MKDKGKEPSIRHSMVKGIILYVLIPFFAALAALCLILRYHLSSGTAEAFRMMFDQNVREIDQSILQANYASSTMVTYTENSKLLKRYYEADNAYEKNKATELIEKLIQSCEIAILGSCQGEMALVMNDGRFISSSGMRDLPEGLESRPWFSPIRRSGQYPYWDNRINELFGDSSDKRYAAFGRTLMRYQEQPQGYAFVRIPESVFERFGEDPRFRQGTIAMYDGGGRLLTGGDGRFSGEQLGDIYEYWQATGRESGRRRGLYYMASRLSYSSNVVIYAAGAHDVFMRSERIVAYALAFMLLVTIALVGIIRAIAKYITDPILFFAGRAPLIEQSRPEFITLEKPRFQEIRELQEGMLQAQRRIRALLEEVRRETAMKEKARFEALTAQINPHFLFNTLNAIRWKAAINQDQEVADIISELGVLLGETYQNTQELEPIGNALRTLEAYVKIMKVRFGGGTQFFFAVPDELREYLIPKFCLQPLVENSFIHGMSHVERGVIALRGRLEGNDLVLTLIDNGPGVHGKDVDLTDDGGRQRRGVTGIGLANIHSRIRALFGGNYGLKVDATVETGFKISLTIPAVRAKKEDKRDEGADC